MPEWVEARVQMPWHPRFLKEALVVCLRRNVGHGKVLEGLEVRWAVVCRLMQALTKLGRWRLDGALGPMHKWYDPRLFDMLSEEEVLWSHAPKRWQGGLIEADEAEELRRQGESVESVDVRTAEEMLAAGLDVRVLGGVGEEVASVGDLSLIHI